MFWLQSDVLPPKNMGIVWLSFFIFRNTQIQRKYLIIFSQQKSQCAINFSIAFPVHNL